MGNSYLKNEEYQIENGILTKYFGEKKKLSIPSRIAGYKVSGIGSKALDMRSIDKLALQEGIEEVFEEAFPYNIVKNLILPSTLKAFGKNNFPPHFPENIVVYRVIPNVAWERIKNDCTRILNGAYLLNPGDLDDVIVDCIWNQCAKERLLPGEVNEQMMILFAAIGDREDIIFDSKAITSKDFMVGYLIRNKIFASVSQEVDNVDDYNYRNYESTRPPGVVLCKVTLDETFRDNDCVRIKVHFMHGIYYWMRIEKLKYNKKTYYISGKEFLNPSAQIPYIKKIEDVYDDSENKVSDKTKEIVLRKYNLLRSIP